MDFGIGEAAAAEGAKAAGEAAIGESAIGADLIGGAGTAIGEGGSTALAGGFGGGAGIPGSEAAGALGYAPTELGGYESVTGNIGGDLGTAGASPAESAGMTSATSTTPEVSASSSFPIGSNLSDFGYEAATGGVGGPAGVSGEQGFNLLNQLNPLNNPVQSVASQGASQMYQDYVQDQAKDEAYKKAAAKAAQPSSMSGIIDKITGNPLQAASLGLGLASSLAGRSKQGDISKQYAALGQPALDVEKSLLSQYQSGQIPASAEFDIQKWQDQQIAAVRSQYSRAGMGDSSAARNAEAAITAKAQALRDQAKQSLLASGLSAAGVANTPMSNAIQAQAQQDQQFMQSQQSALNSLMLLQAMQGKTGTTGGAGNVE